MGQISFRIQDQFKKEFEELCEELGMTPTTALTIFIKKMCREKRIPFDVSLPNATTVQAMEDVRNHQNLSVSFENIESLMGQTNS